MSLTDIMSHSDLSWYPQVALIIFLSVFVTVSLRVMFSRRRCEVYARMSVLPLDEPTAHDTTSAASHHS